MTILRELESGGWAVADTDVSAITLLDAAVDTGAGSNYDLGESRSRFTCAVEWGGATPTSTTVKLQGSIDNVLWADLQTVVVSASGTMFHVIEKLVRYIRGNYVSKVGGDATTSVTMKCQAGGN